jgi:hypothetical protein
MPNPYNTITRGLVGAWHAMPKMYLCALHPSHTKFLLHKHPDSINRLLTFGQLRCE